MGRVKKMGGSRGMVWYGKGEDRRRGRENIMEWNGVWQGRVR